MFVPFSLPDVGQKGFSEDLPGKWWTLKLENNSDSAVHIIPASSRA